MAWSDRPWVLEGAAVRVSLIGFDNGAEQNRILDGMPVKTINADLSGTTNLTRAQRLVENSGIAFMGDTKVGPFDLDYEKANSLLRLSGNPNGRPNSDVIMPWANGLDITRRPRNMWIIDFGVGTPEAVAAEYEAPFEYIRQHVREFRAAARSGDRTGVS